MRTETAACSSARSVLDVYKRWKGKRDTSTGNAVTRLLSITIAEKNSAKFKVQTCDKHTSEGVRVHILTSR